MALGYLLYKTAMYITKKLIIKNKAILINTILCIAMLINLYKDMYPLFKQEAAKKISQSLKS